MSEIRPAEFDPDHVPDALMLLGTHCPHCPMVLAALSELVKKGQIASLEVVNLEKKPEIAQELGVRTVPWVRIGWFELEGLHSKAELEQWTQRAGSREGAREYLSETLAAGQVNKVLAMLKIQPGLMAYVLDLLDDADAKINIRLGIGVIIEEHAAQKGFAQYIPRLGEFTKYADERVRSDACHYLSLTKNSDAVPYIKALLNDVSVEVREVAEESLEELKI